MFHANNIEACIEQVCNISNRYFQKLPLAFRATQFVDNTFSANNLTCTIITIDNVETIVTLLWQSPKNWSHTGPKVMTVTVIRVPCTMYIHITMLPENGEQAYRIYVGRRPTIKYVYAVLTPQSVELDPGCERTQAGLSLDSLSQRQVRRPQHFICNAAFPASFATELHEGAYWKHYSLCSSF